MAEALWGSPVLGRCFGETSGTCLGYTINLLSSLGQGTGTVPCCPCSEHCASPLGSAARFILRLLGLSACLPGAQQHCAPAGRWFPALQRKKHRTLANGSLQPRVSPPLLNRDAKVAFKELPREGCNGRGKPSNAGDFLSTSQEQCWPGKLRREQMLPAWAGRYDIFPFCPCSPCRPHAQPLCSALAGEDGQPDLRQLHLGQPL